MPESRFLLVALASMFCATGLLAQQPQANPDKEKHGFRMQTDSGRYGAGAQRLDPKLLGVGIYPGARVDERESGGKGADLWLDWGQEGIRLYVEKYVTSDPSEKVVAFYRKQLSRYGVVVECRDGKPVAKVDSDLKCDDDAKEGKDNAEHKTIELKAGTESRQHVIGVTPREKGTDFQIVYVEHTKRGEL